MVGIPDRVTAKPEPYLLRSLIRNYTSCKFFGDGTGQSMKMHARVDFLRVRQANTQEVSRWHAFARSEEHTSELQSQSNLVCRLLLEKKKKKKRRQRLR